MQLNIDDDLCERMKRRASRHEFDSVDEYAETVLRTVMDELEGEQAEDIEDRLADLGYL